MTSARVDLASWLAIACFPWIFCIAAVDQRKSKEEGVSTQILEFFGESFNCDYNKPNHTNTIFGAEWNRMGLHACPGQNQSSASLVVLSISILTFH